MGGGGLRGALVTEPKPEDAGDGEIGVGREERASSAANWEFDFSDVPEVRRAAESNAWGKHGPMFGRNPVPTRWKVFELVEIFCGGVRSGGYGAVQLP